MWVCVGSPTCFIPCFVVITLFIGHGAIPNIVLELAFLQVIVTFYIIGKIVDINEEPTVTLLKLVCKHFKRLQRLILRRTFI